MKKIVASAVIWAVLWGAGMLLFGLNVSGPTVDVSWVLATPLILAAALAVWGTISGKGGAGTIAGTIFGIIFGTGALLGSFLGGQLLSREFYDEGLVAERIAWLAAGGIVGGVAGACLEMARQGTRNEDKS